MSRLSFVQFVLLCTCRCFWCHVSSKSSPELGSETATQLKISRLDARFSSAEVVLALLMGKYSAELKHDEGGGHLLSL